MEQKKVLRLRWMPSIERACMRENDSRANEKARQLKGVHPMSNRLRGLVLLVFLLMAWRLTSAHCGNHWDYQYEDSAGTVACEGHDSFIKRVFWRIVWNDGHTEDLDVYNSGTSLYYT